MTIIIQMYRTCQYTSWDDASKSGGVYFVPVPAAETCSPYDNAVADAVKCILAACDMMDSGFSISLRVGDDDIEYYTPLGEYARGKEIISAEHAFKYKAFIEAFNRHCLQCSTRDIIEALVLFDDGKSYTHCYYGTTIIDAWMLWNSALTHAREIK